jgi:hypothetical protein
MGERPGVGDRVYLPKRGIPGPVGDAITGTPGRVDSIDDGWAMVDRGDWGQFGCPLDDLSPADDYPEG